MNRQLEFTKDNMYEHAIKVGDLELVKFLYEKGYPFKEKDTHFYDLGTCSLAAQSGNLDILKYIHEKGCPLGAHAYTKAGVNGHLHIVKYLYEQGLEWDDCVYVHSATKGHLDIIEFLDEKNYPKNPKLDMCSIVARDGYIHLLKYFRGQGCTWGPKTYAAAALRGRVDVISYLRANGCEWDVTTTAEVAMEGTIDMLEYLHNHGCPWDETTCAAAVYNESNNINIVRYLRDHGCPWDHKMWDAAIHENDEDVFDYLCNNGLDFDPKYYSALIMKGSLCMFQRVYQGEDNPDLCYYASFFGKLDILKYLRERHCSWDDRCYTFTMPKVEHFHDNYDDILMELDMAFGLLNDYLQARIEIFSYLVVNNCPWSPSLYVNIVETNMEYEEWHWRRCHNYRLVKTLRNLNCAWDSQSLNAAIKCNDYVLIQYFIKHDCPHDINTYITAAIQYLKTGDNLLFDTIDSYYTSPMNQENVNTIKNAIINHSLHYLKYFISRSSIDPSQVGFNSLQCKAIQTAISHFDESNTDLTLTESDHSELDEDNEFDHEEDEENGDDGDDNDATDELYSDELSSEQLKLGHTANMNNSSNSDDEIDSENCDASDTDDIDENEGKTQSDKATEGLDIVAARWCYIENALMNKYVKYCLPFNLDEQIEKLQKQINDAVTVESEYFKLKFSSMVETQINTCTTGWLWTIGIGMIVILDQLPEFGGHRLGLVVIQSYKNRLFAIELKTISPEELSQIRTIDELLSRMKLNMQDVIEQLKDNTLTALHSHGLFLHLQGHNKPMTCPICSDNKAFFAFDCQHSICHGCYTALVNNGYNIHKTLKCPVCRCHLRQTEPSKYLEPIE